MLNTTVLGRYEIIKQVRENDLFVEYWGRDAQTGQDVTAVVIHARLAPAAEFFPRFEPATKKLSNRTSKHATAWIGSGEVNGQAVIVREHVDGLSLSGMLAMGEGGLPMEAVLDIAQQLGEYLDSIHPLGLTQTIFDFEDVLLSTGNSVQVTNFGIPQGLDIGGLLSAGRIQARSSYAPELIKGGQADARADFYSLGAILFQAITGRELDADFISADKTLMDDFLPSRMRSGIPTEWDVLIAKCLHSNPARRIQSAVEFLNQVEEIHRAGMTVASGNLLGMEDLLVGQTLGGYRLVSRLGQGGMATVYKAYEPALDRYVAIKVLPQFFAKDPVFVQRFRREAKAVAQLSHPNIVPIYSYGESSGITYIAMQFVVGDTLKHGGQKFGFDESLRLLAPIARALGYAHQHGIVHRDIKPSNILLADGNWPMLADFGLAQMAQASGKLTESGVGMGTPMYMSPEQGQGDKVDYRTDIYSLGIVLYEMVTGDVPFRADTPMAIVIKHINAPMPMPRQVNPNVPEYLEAVVLKATAKNPDDRYQTAEEMAVAMENALSRLLSDIPAGRVQPSAAKKPAEAGPRPKVKKEARLSSSRKFLWAAIFSIVGIIGVACLAVGLMGVFGICPPSGSWDMLPWCEVSPTPVSESLSDASVGTIVDDFESGTPAGRTDWESYFEDNRDTTLDCYVEDSHELRDSNYLNFEFDVAENSWATCGFYFDSVQDWSAGEGIAFSLRSDQPNAEYQIEVFGGRPNALTTYVYWTETPPESADGWVRIEIPWSEILRADWEENPGASIDPANVTGFVIGISTPETSRQSGTLWMDDLSLFGSAAASLSQEPNLFMDDFENLDRTDLESYFADGSDTTTACSLDDTVAYEGSASLKFYFDVAPNAWASCSSSFNSVMDWSAGQGVAFYVHTDRANMIYEIYLFGGPLGAHETYLYELTTPLNSFYDWERVELYWDDFRRADWEENAGTPVNPASVIGFAFTVSAPQDARLAGTLWIDDFQVIP